MGTIIHVMEKRQLIHTANQTTVIARAIVVRDYREATVLVRVYDNQMGTGSSVKVTVKAVAPSEDQPETDFMEDANAAQATVDTGTGSATGKLVRAALSANFGGWVLIQLEATKGSGNCNCTIDIDLSVKE